MTCGAGVEGEINTQSGIRSLLRFLQKACIFAMHTSMLILVLADAVDVSESAWRWLREGLAEAGRRPCIDAAA
jgi:hypothetical protein